MSVLLHFLTHEVRTIRLSRNVSKELPLNAALYLRRVEISHDDLAMQAMVWLRTVQFRAIWFVAVQFGASHANLRQIHIFECQI